MSRETVAAWVQASRAPFFVATLIPLVLGGVVAFFYFRHHKLDFRLLLDAVAPALLVGQALVRPANFINQELYGQPTELPWGIRIEALHRIAPWDNMLQYPYETTFFHPTFAYEMLWNFLATGILLWIAVVVAGGLAGSWSGSFRLSAVQLKYLVTAVLLMASIKLYIM